MTDAAYVSDAVWVTGPAHVTGPGVPAGRAPRLLAPALWAVGGLLAAAVLHVRDPHVAGSYAHCPLLSVLGIPCPACGGLRAVADLTHCQLTQAMSSNGYVAVSLCALVLWWVAWGSARLAGRAAPLSRSAGPVATAWLVGLLVFGLLRLLPALAWLQP